MRIVKGYPPNYRQIVAQFPAARGHGTVFAWGETIFNPSDVKLTPADQAHEAEHGRRQADYQDPVDGERGIAAWWARYMADAKFRFDEEVVAHRTEWREAKARLKGSRLDEYLNMMANRLSGLLYGRMVSFDAAKDLITEGAE